jgi:hypothetical protein
MTALTADRSTPSRAGISRSGAVAASTTIYAGAMLMRDASGYIVEGQTATGLVGVGRAEKAVDNSAGSAGDKTAEFRPGTFYWAHSAGADEITIADIGQKAYAVDDQTVAKTDGTSTRSPAGIVDDVDANGVWVRMDEALTNAA